MSKVTQKDIADTLGVSRMTVSKALNGGIGITDAMKQQVLSKAYELGYAKIPEDEFNKLYNIEKTNNLLSKTKIISLFTSTACNTDAYFGQVVFGMADTVAKMGYDLSLCFLNFIGDNDFELPNNFNKQNSSGIVILGSFSRKQIEKVKEIGLPTISIDTLCECEKNGLMVDTIMTYNASPMMEATNHLINKGHIKIGYIGYIVTNDTVLGLAERWQGFCQAMKSANLEIHDKYCITCADGKPLDEEMMMCAFPNIEDLPTAFVCANDSIAITVLKFLKKKKIKVPDDVSVVGFDNVNEASLFDLTTVDVPKLLLGVRAGEEMIWRINNINRPYEMIRISTSIVYRKTTGMPRDTTNV